MNKVTKGIVALKKIRVHSENFGVRVFPDWYTYAALKCMGVLYDYDIVCAWYKLPGRRSATALSTPSTMSILMGKRNMGCTLWSFGDTARYPFCFSMKLVQLIGRRSCSPCYAGKRAGYTPRWLLLSASVPWCVHVVREMGPFHRPSSMRS